MFVCVYIYNLKTTYNINPNNPTNNYVYNQYMSPIKPVYLYLVLRHINYII